MTRSGELAGHLWSDDPGFRRLILRAIHQTGELAHRPGPRIDYMVVPLEAVRAAAAELGAMSARQFEREWKAADRRIFRPSCMERRLDHELEVELTCLLPAGHDAPCGWHRFLDAVERGELEAQAAEARLQARFDTALEEAKRRIDRVALRNLAEAVARVDPLDTLRRAYAELDLEAGAEDD